MKPFTYHVSLLHDREHNRFTVICEEFPELIVTGNSPAGAFHAMRVAIQQVLAKLSEAGMNIPAEVEPTLVANNGKHPRAPGLTFPVDEPGRGTRSRKPWARWAPAGRPHRRLTVARCKIVQVKEKFGGLRIYYDYPSIEEGGVFDRSRWAAIDRWERWIEMRSFTVCEACGRSGSEVGHGGWYRTLCAACGVRWTEGAIRREDICGDSPPGSP
jgi:predicted RNase H-like HicB family nuclease